MAAFLLSWNPDKFHWDNLRKDITRIQKKGSAIEKWSCGSRTDLPVGSEIFLIRLGPEPKGLVGRGVAESEPEEDTHWDPEKRRQKIKALYVKVRFTDLAEAPVIPWGELQKLPLSRFKWSIVGSGVALPGVIVEELHRRWDIAKAEHVRWSSHPYSRELAPEFAILEDVAIPETEREALISARRGQGRFRERVLAAEPRCRVTGIDDPDYLVASHIKPWAESTNAERLSGDNGLMLAPHVDHLFDKGFISFTDNGDMLVSEKCSKGVLATWGIDPDKNVGPFRVGQRPFLAYHREHVLKK